MEIGIIGLPNVGKSTLFNALTSQNVEASNYPFCTIDENIGIVEIKDKRLLQLKDLVKPDKYTFSTVKFVDIAGLVENAHKGEGLGNKFLAKIREVDAVIHLIRIFDDKNVTHSYNNIDASRDIRVINTEIILSDIEVTGKHIDKLKKQAKSNDKDIIKELDLCENLYKLLNENKRAEFFKFDEKSIPGAFTNFLSQLISFKPVLYVFNVNENDINNNIVDEIVKQFNEDINYLQVSAKIESELSELDNDEKLLFKEELGISEDSIDRLIKKAYSLLDFLTFFTIVGAEIRAWPLKKGSTVIEAAEKIHSDIAEGFIKAEVIGFDTLIKFSSYSEAKSAGKVFFHSKDYIVQDGDIIQILFKN